MFCLFFGDLWRVKVLDFGLELVFGDLVYGLFTVGFYFVDVIFGCCFGLFIS